MIFLFEGHFWLPHKTVSYKLYTDIINLNEDKPIWSFSGKTQNINYNNFMYKIINSLHWVKNWCEATEPGSNLITNNVF